MHYQRDAMSPEQARELLSVRADLDYLEGRALKVALTGEQLDPWLYDRDYGEGMALRALRAEGLL